MKSVLILVVIAAATGYGHAEREIKPNKGPLEAPQKHIATQDDNDQPPEAMNMGDEVVIAKVFHVPSMHEKKYNCPPRHRSHKRVHEHHRRHRKGHHGCGDRKGRHDRHCKHSSDESHSHKRSDSSEKSRKSRRRNEWQSTTPLPWISSQGSGRDRQWTTQTAPPQSSNTNGQWTGATTPPHWMLSQGSGTDGYWTTATTLSSN